MLAKRFEDILHKLGMAELEHPLFYHAPVGVGLNRRGGTNLWTGVRRS